MQDREMNEIMADIFNMLNDMDWVNQPVLNQAEEKIAIAFYGLVLNRFNYSSESNEDDEGY